MTHLGQSRLTQVLFAVAALTFFITPLATDDTNFVNDQGQTSGDIFQQNAQDQN